MPIDNWVKRAEGLYTRFVDGTLPVDIPSLADLSEAAAGGIAEIQKALEQKWKKQAKSRGKGKRAEQVPSPGKRARRYPVTLDTQLLNAVLTPLAPSSSSAGSEREEWRKLLAQLLTLSIKSIPGPSDLRGDEVDGLPSAFDQWVFERVASLLPLLPADQARSLWEPILNVGIPAHAWVEQFFWHWFTDGYNHVPTPEAFTALWEEMLRHCLQSPNWVSNRNTYDLARMITEILGFHFGIETVAKDTAYTESLGKMTPVFEDVASKWFEMESVADGFARFVVAPAATKLLLPAVRWLGKALEIVKPTKSERRLDGALLISSAWRGSDIGRSSLMTRIPRAHFRGCWRGYRLPATTPHSP